MITTIAHAIKLEMGIFVCYLLNALIMKPNNQAIALCIQMTVIGQSNMMKFYLS
jgi:hypothetical protein